MYLILHNTGNFAGAKKRTFISGSSQMGITENVSVDDIILHNHLTGEGRECSDAVMKIQRGKGLTLRAAELPSSQPFCLVLA